MDRDEIQEILKNQELAEKWLKITENPNWVKGTREFSELYEIVERLKQSIEYWKSKNYNDQVASGQLNELQKILGEKT